MKKIIIQCAFLLSTATWAQWNPSPSTNLPALSNISYSTMKAIVGSNGRTYIVAYGDRGTGMVPNFQILNESGHRRKAQSGSYLLTPPSGTSSIPVPKWDFQIDLSDDATYLGYTSVAYNYTSYVVKVDSIGDPMWLSTISIANSKDVKLLPIGSGQCFLAWTDISTNHGKVQKIGANGSYLWTNPIDIAPSTAGWEVVINQMHKLQNGDVEVLYAHHNTTSSWGFPYLQKVSNTGNLIWSQPVQLTDQSMQVAVEGDIQILGIGDTLYVGLDQSSGGIHQSTLHKVNPDGTLPWSTAGVPFASTSAFNSSNLHLQYANGDIQCVAEISTSSQFGIAAQKVNPQTGHLPWGSNGRSVIPMSGSDLILVGMETSSSSRPMIVLGKQLNGYAMPNLLMGVSLDTAAAIIDSVTIGNSSFTKHYPMVAGIYNDSTITLWGEDRNLHTYAATEVYAQKSEIGTTYLGQNELAMSLGIYPNPCAGLIQHHGTAPLENVIISNSQGQIVAHKNIWTRDTPWDLSLVPSGVYFIQSGIHHSYFYKL
jgi:hypothetical protein